MVECLVFQTRSSISLWASLWLCLQLCVCAHRLHYASVEVEKAFAITAYVWIRVFVYISKVSFKVSYIAIYGCVI